MCIRDRIKAEAFCKATGLPTVADYSGLCVDALNGAPGVYSARYAGEHGNDAANNEKLMAEMQNVPVGPVSYTHLDVYKRQEITHAN